MRRPRAEGFRWDLWILVGWCTAFSVMGAGRVQDTDPYWQVRAGQEWLDGSPLARPDSWSWAPVDGLFYPNSPLWNAALAAAWGLAESWGMFVLTALTIGAYYALVVHLARRLGASVLGTTVAIIVVSLAALPLLSPRAGMPAQVLALAGIAAAYAWSRRAERVPAAVSAVVVGTGGLALSLLGNWVHLSWSTTALGVAVSWAAIWLLTPTLGRSHRIVLVAAGTLGLLAGVGLGPYGWSAFGRARAVVTASAGVIEEWTGPFTTASGLAWGVLAIAIVAGCLGSAWWCLRSWTVHRTGDPRLPLTSAITVLALPTALVGLAYARFVPSAILTMAPIAAMVSTYLLTRLFAHAPLSRRPDLLTEVVWQRILGLVLVVLAPVALIIGSPHASPLSAGANSALPAECRLFSTPDEAASVILTRPDVTVWIDGRSDYWQRERLQQAQEYLAVRQPAELVPPGTTCILLPGPGSPGDPVPLVAALDANPSWERVADDGHAILWLPTVSPAD